MRTAEFSSQASSPGTYDAGSMAFSGDRAPGARRKAIDAAAPQHAPGPGERVCPSNAKGSPAPLPRGERERVREGNPSRQGPERASLDRHASNASTGAGSREVSAPSSKDEHRGRRHALRHAAGMALPKERVARCGQAAMGPIVSLHHREGHAHFGAVETCSSVWTCPVCAAKITEGRREDLDKLLTAHEAVSGTAYMATLTVPHSRFQGCRDLRRAVAEAFRAVKSGRAWQTARDGYGWMGDVRALEVTHGKNGWHPHLHVLFFFTPGTTEAQALAFRSWLYDAWARAVARQGYGACSADAFTFERVDMAAGAAAYVGKWGAALEITKGHVKQGRGGRTPWQILADLAIAGEEGDRRLFQEFAVAFKGARQLTWSRNLRRHYLGEDEKTDDELAVDHPMAETHVASLARPLFATLVKARATAELLQAIENGGTEGVLKLLTARGIPWRVIDAPSLQTGRTVPLIAPGDPWGTPFPRSLHLDFCGFEGRGTFPLSENQGDHE